MALFEARPEPVDALLRRTVREGVGDDRAARLPLQPIVADRGGGAECFLDVARLEPVVPRLGTIRPDAGEAIRLQLLTNRQPRCAFHAFAAGACLPDPIEDAEQVLHVVSDLVGDDVRLGKIAAAAEMRLHLAEEAQVEIHLPIVRTIERAARGGRTAARRLHGAGEEDESRSLVLATRPPERGVPDVLGLAEDRAHEVDALVVGAAVRRGARVVARLHRRALGLQNETEDLQRALAHQEAGDDDDGDAAEPERHPHADAGTAFILDVVALARISPPHALLLPPSTLHSRRRTGKRVAADAMRSARSTAAAQGRIVRFGWCRRKYAAIVAAASKLPTRIAGHASACSTLSANVIAPTRNPNMKITKKSKMPKP